MYQPTDPPEVAAARWRLDMAKASADTAGTLQYAVGLLAAVAAYFWRHDYWLAVVMFFAIGWIAKFPYDQKLRDAGRKFETACEREDERRLGGQHIRDIGR